jgi:hypothetical protein
VATSGGERRDRLAPDVYDGVVQTIHLVANLEMLAGVRAAESS